MNPAVRPSLQTVTLCAVSSTAVDSTIEALLRSAQECKFGAVKLISDSNADIIPDGSIKLIRIKPIQSRADYSKFVVQELHHHIDTEHALLVQWDGFVIDGRKWNDEFLSYDYIGAVWPQFIDGANVGNGGFSLRSRRLMQLCSQLPMPSNAVEDLHICRELRPTLERDYGMRFCPEEVARHFSIERETQCFGTFGFHGIFNFSRLMGDDFLISTLDRLPPSTVGVAEYRAIVVDLIVRRRLQTAISVLRKIANERLSISTMIRLGAGVTRDLLKYCCPPSQSGSKAN